MRLVPHAGRRASTSPRATDARCLQQGAIVEGHRWRLRLDGRDAGNVAQQILCTLAHLRKEPQFLPRPGGRGGEGCGERLRALRASTLPPRVQSASQPEPVARGRPTICSPWTAAGGPAACSRQARTPPRLSPAAAPPEPPGHAAASIFYFAAPVHFLTVTFVVFTTPRDVWRVGALSTAAASCAALRAVQYGCSVQCSRIGQRARHDCSASWRPQGGRRPCASLPSPELRWGSPLAI